MREPLNDIPSYVAELFEAERQAPRPSADVERRVRGRVAATLTLTVAGASSLAASSAVASAVGLSAKAGGLALAIKASVVVVGLGVLGTAGGIAWRHQTVGKAKPEGSFHAVAVRSRARPGKLAAQSLPGSAQPTAAPEMSQPSLPVPQPQSAPATSLAGKRPVQPMRAAAVVLRQEDSEPGSLAKESPLLDRARVSLDTHNVAQALLLLDEHKRQFPHGQLEEEREALGVQALVAGGNPAGARARAVEFRRRFPRSIQLPVVEAAELSVGQ